MMSRGLVDCVVATDVGTAAGICTDKEVWAVGLCLYMHHDQSMGCDYFKVGMPPEAGHGSWSSQSRAMHQATNAIAAINFWTGFLRGKRAILYTNLWTADGAAGDSRLSEDAEARIRDEIHRLQECEACAIDWRNIVPYGYEQAFTELRGIHFEEFRSRISRMTHDAGIVGQCLFRDVSVRRDLSSELKEVDKAQGTWALYKARKEQQRRVTFGSWIRTHMPGPKWTLAIAALAAFLAIPSDWIGTGDITLADQ